MLLDRGGANKPRRLDFVWVVRLCFRLCAGAGELVCIRPGADPVWILKSAPRTSLRLGSGRSSGGSLSKLIGGEQPNSPEIRALDRTRLLVFTASASCL